MGTKKSAVLILTSAKKVKFAFANYYETKLGRLMNHKKLEEASGNKNESLWGDEHRS